MSLSISGFNGFSVFSQRFATNGILNATQDKMERQQKAQGQIDFLEKQKKNLKNMQCDNIEDIAKKLEMFHAYEDQIAELAEDNAPKTEEERKEEMVEEALNIEDKGGFTESMEDVQKITEEMVEEHATENLEVLDETITAEGEVLTETELLTLEDVRYKKNDNYILFPFR